MLHLIRTITLSLFFLLVPSLSYSQCCLWNMQRLQNVKMNPDYEQTREEILKRADRMVSMKPLTVINTEKPLVLDKHYYFSMPPYWWYDENEGKYIRKDGVRNEDNAVYDNQKIVQLARRLKYFSVSYYFTNEQKYLNAYRQQLKVWFIDPKTKMYPNFEYAQVIPGQNNDKGRSVGLIDGYCLNEVVESLRLVMMTDTEDIPEMAAIKVWFNDMLQWLLTSWQGVKIGQSIANSSVSYDVMLVNFSMFVGRNDVCSNVSKNFGEKRLNLQITRDGRQPEELTRTKAYSYSIMNLSHMLDFCLLQLSQGNDYYGLNHQIIDKAYNYLYYYRDKEKEWPYEQITSWDDEVNNLNIVSEKKEYLRRHSKRYWFRNLFKSNKMSVNNYDSEVINRVLH